MALAGYPPVFAGDQAGPLIVIGTVAVGLAVASAAGAWPAAVGWALGLLGLEYVLSLYLSGGGLGLATPIYAALMLLTGELVYLARQLDVPVDRGEAVVRRRFGLIAALALGSLLLCSFLLALALAPLPSGVWLTAVGTAAAVAALAMVLSTARRH